MSKAARLTASLAGGAVLVAVYVMVDGSSYWIGVGCLVFAAVGLTESVMRYVRGDWPRSHAIVNALWSVVGVNIGLYFLLEVNWFILGYTTLAVGTAFYQVRHHRAMTRRVEPEVSAQ